MLRHAYNDRLDQQSASGRVVAGHRRVNGRPSSLSHLHSLAEIASAVVSVMPSTVIWWCWLGAREHWFCSLCSTGSNSGLDPVYYSIAQVLGC